jgi:acetyl/propionyl-CoA carboxylase alpha subunit
MDSDEQNTVSNETIIAPTQATIERINVSLGDNVNNGDPIVVLTAMKMEVSISYVNTMC